MDVFRSVQQTGNSGVVILSGHAGSGKTYLVREAIERMTKDGALAATAKVDQFSSDVPYTAIVSNPSSQLTVGPMHRRDCSATLFRKQRRSHAFRQQRIIYDWCRYVSLT
jgi:predicted ATPase